MQRMLIIGGTGTIGRLIVAEMGRVYDIITASRNSGDFQVDISDQQSLSDLFASVGQIDVLICAAGGILFRPIEDFTDEDINFAVSGKLMGQFNVVRKGLPYINDNGSIVLTSGCTNVQAVNKGCLSGLVNGGLSGFVNCAASDMPRGIRVNCVSPGYVRESGGDESQCPGFKLVEGVDVARAYHRCVATRITGHVIEVH